MPMELPAGSHVEWRFMNFFTFKSIEVKSEERGSGGIAMVRDSGNKKHYVMLFYGGKQAGFYIPNYCKGFPSLFEAMVIYKKFKVALDKGYLEKFWEDNKARRRQPSDPISATRLRRKTV